MKDLKAIASPSDAAALFRASSPKVEKEERVFVLPMDANGKVLAKPILVSVGHQGGTAAIDAGAIFREALKAGAEEIIVAHNHPSGDTTPSKADIAATKELKDLAERLGVVLLDHIIIGSAVSTGGAGFVSLAEALPLRHCVSRHSLRSAWPLTQGSRPPIRGGYA